VVTALDILEHVDDDNAALRELWRLSKPGGSLLITVPAFGFLWSEHDEALQHRRRYTAAELESKLVAAGFQVVQMSYFLASLFVPILAFRIVQNLTKRGIEPQATYVIPPPWLNVLIVRILDWERMLLRHVKKLPFGVSIIALAKKPARTKPQPEQQAPRTEERIAEEPLAHAR
jgi:SAM-dependent methyltransferase